MTDETTTVAVVPPPAPAPSADGMNSRTRRRQTYLARQQAERGGGGRGSTAPSGTAPREGTEEKVGIPGIPYFCTPAENGDKARFDKVQS